MCRSIVYQFFIDNANFEEFEDKLVLEVGSKYVNGSIRPLIEKFLKTKKYIGIDVEPGKFVDVVLSAEKILERFGPDSLDVVITFETMEHIQDWRKVILAIKTILKPGGLLYMTTVEKGFQYHGYPYDFWRYDLLDLKQIFKDFEIDVLKRDFGHGILLKARKPKNYVKSDISDIALYSMVLGKRTVMVPKTLDMPWSRRTTLKVLKLRIFALLPSCVVNFLEERLTK